MYKTKSNTFQCFVIPKHSFIFDYLTSNQKIYFRNGHHKVSPQGLFLNQRGKITDIDE